MSESDISSSQSLQEHVVSLQRVINLTDLLFRGTKNKRYKWLLELSEALKHSHTIPMNLTFGFKPGARGCHAAHFNSVCQLLTLLRDSLLHMRYEESIEILKTIVSGCRVKMPLALETAIYRSGLEIMYNLPHLARHPFHEFLNSFKRVTSILNPQQSATEQFTHLLAKKGLDEAVECISFLPKVANSIASTHQGRQVAQLFRAYKGLATYLEFERERTSESQTSTQTSFFNPISQCDTLAENALADLMSVTDQAGVWDIFIACQVELLLHLRSDVQALQQLKNYKKRNEDNPNAYRNLIEYYRCHDDDEELKGELMAYCDKWPSDKERSLMLIDKMDMSVDSQCQRAVKTFFNLLDYSCHKDDLELWHSFHDFLSDECASSKYVRNEWSERRSWWIPYHFTHRGLNSELSKVKDDVLRLLA